MQFGAQLVNYFCEWDDTLATIKTVQAGRWHSLWWSDHFLPPVGRADMEHERALEGWSLLTAAAAITERLQLGLLVTGNTYRNPALLAKMAATIDQISHGRLILGIGAAWFKREHEAYGWTFPSMKERQDRFEEAVELIRALFRSGESVDFQGEYYRLDSAPLSPGCYADPIPILVGGTGEKRTLRTLARHGDVMNLDGWARGPMTREYFQHKVSVVNRHCEDAGRDPGEIRHTVLMPTFVTDDEAAARRFVDARGLGEGTASGPKSYVIDRIGEMIDAGAHEIMIGGIPTQKLDHYQMVAEEIIPAFD